MDVNLLKTVILEFLPEIGDDDDNVMDYFITMLKDNKEALNLNFLLENFIPFLESYGTQILETNQPSEQICISLTKRLRELGLDDDEDDGPKLLDRAITLSSISKQKISASEKEAIDTLWGFQKIRGKRNDQFEATEAASAKYERKAAKEQKKFLEDLDTKFRNSQAEEAQISAMTLPDLSGNSREKDIQVNNFTITYGGNILLEGADLRIVYGRRYGLVGRNGVGKTTLLKHMASFDIEGFPRHHRVLHVKQEVQSSEKSVLQVVLESDVERNVLLAKEKQLLQAQQNVKDDNSVQLQEITNQLTEVYSRMEQIGAQSAESRAAQILSGLQFSESMQKASTDSLSGGWRMRVSLAAALFIEPDLLMLDEPTNHLDLEAVLWLEDYLQSYPHTVLLVSHDRAFLDEVCTDIILFKNLKLTYFRGNYTQYEATAEEMALVRHRQREAQMVKIQHMQEFVDKFRFNAKRASLVQSRIKAIERESVVEEEVEDAKFEFFFPDSGQLGRPVIEIEGVTFGYDIERPLFKNVHLGIDQSSRVALVGPNGTGKSTLLKLIQNQLRPIEGIVHVNPQLRIGIFTQHHLDSFDLLYSALENMQKRWPLATEAELRAHLGRFEIHGNDALKPLKFTSGGQKSRVAFACLTYTKPHVVVLDEPTNHLDMNAIEALINALKKFTGGVLVVSHDQHFITSVCNEIWVIGKQRVTKFNGEFIDYKRQVISEIARKKSH